jgi:hypothetical protein
MRMDAAYYQELAGRPHGLLTGVDDRIAGQARLPRTSPASADTAWHWRKSPARSPRT